MLPSTQTHRRCPISSPSNSYNGGGNTRPYNRGGRYVDQTRVNDRIRAPKVRVVDGTTAKQLGVMPTSQAIRLAKEQGLDLVEVAGTVDPPVCKIVDYGKYKYLQEKHKKEAHKAHKTSKLKEMKFRVGIDPHDYSIKITHAEDFLADGHKVRIQLQFRGRQMAHQDIGFKLMQRVKGDLATMCHVDMEPRMAGRNINMQLSPLPERQRVRKFRVAGKLEDSAHIPHASTVNVNLKEEAHDAEHGVQEEPEDRMDGQILDGAEHPTGQVLETASEQN